MVPHNVGRPHGEACLCRVFVCSRPISPELLVSQALCVRDAWYAFALGMRVNKSERLTRANRQHQGAVSASNGALGEGCFIQHNNVHTRLFAGFLLFRIFARVRCADGSRITTEPVLDVAEDGTGFQTSLRVNVKLRGQPL